MKTQKWLLGFSCLCLLTACGESSSSSLATTSSGDSQSPGTSLASSPAVASSPLPESSSQEMASSVPQESSAQPAISSQAPETASSLTSSAPAETGSSAAPIASSSPVEPEVSSSSLAYYSITCATTALRLTYLDDGFLSNHVESGALVRFSAETYSERYAIDDIYFQAANETQKHYLSADDGVYSFSMPSADVNIYGEILTMHSIAVVAENATVSFVDGQQDYYLPYTEVRFTVSVAEGYHLDSVVWASGSSNSWTLTPDEEGVYSKKVYSDDVTLTVTASETMDASTDPWSGKSTSYSGTVLSTSDYMTQLTMTFNGDGTLSYATHIEYWYDDWGGDEYWEAPLPPKRDWETWSDDYAHYENAVYSYEEASATYKASVKGHGMAYFDLKFQVSGAGSQVTSIKVLTDIDSTYVPSAGKTLTLVK